MLDILFLSYDEPNADENFAKLKARFPHARRVHGVTGIANAHIAAAKKSLTKFFYVVDGDAEIHDDFDFSYKPGPGDEEFVHVWYAHNPAIGVAYGYGGVKLFSKLFFKDVKTQLDFTTTLTKDIKVIPTTVCTTNFNSDSERAFRGAFRETAKLYRTINDEAKPEAVRLEAEDRLQRWLNPLECRFKFFVEMGAKIGLRESKEREDLSFINNHALILQMMDGAYRSAEYQDTNPSLPATHPMKPEFFFTSRIASAYYDQFVLDNLPITEIRDAMSDGQMLSKHWLVEKLTELIEDGKIPANARVGILGGWIGTLSLLLNAHDSQLKVTSIDLDERANRIAEKLNYDFDGFKTMTMDMYDIDYDQFDVIINTSSEHIPDIAAWRNSIPADKIIVVQNNNFLDGDGHISCVSNSSELRVVLKIDPLYEGTKVFPQYDRYMLVGRT